ncbi:MAG: iron chelate uptake ABC transporter family permease subunit, partial [Actinomyces sp.]
MRGIRLNRAAAPVRPPAGTGPRRSFHVGADAGRLWIVVGRWSVLIAPSHVIVGLMLLVLSLAVAVVSLRLGKFPVTTQEVIDALQGQGRKIVQVVVVKWKLPRIVLGLVAGLALGVAGALFQTITRNPLGSPDLIGFSTGAQTGILISILLLPGSMLSA